MRKYKTSEAIAMLEKQQNLEFKNAKGKIIKFSFGCVRFFEGEKNVQRYGIEVPDEWELIQQPIPFMEAVKAYSEGKTIRCEYDGASFTHVRRPERFEKDVINFDSILKGRWYAEDSNE